MSLYLATLLMSFVFYGIAFLIARNKGKPALGDHFWGIGFIVITGFCFLYRVLGYTTGVSWQTTNLCENQPLKFVATCPEGPISVSTNLITFLPALVLGGLIVLWAIRLSRHTMVRNKQNSLDWRYANWRALGKSTSVNGIFLQKYFIQAILLWVISLPLQFLFTIEFDRDTYRDSLIYGPVLIGTGIWLIGFLIESVSDWQLNRFNRHKANHGKILEHGFWKYSRHPNYFGEIVMWWGIFFVTLAAPTPALWLLVSPLLISYMIRFVSGVPVLEKHYADNKAYQAYKRHTNTLVPWLRKR